MAKKPKNIIKRAKRMIKKNYVYVYGYKGTKVTESGVRNLARMYPNVFTSSILNACLKKIGKIGIDCSGFVNKSAGTSLGGSSQIRSSAPKVWKVSDVSHVKTGMFIWRSGHIGLIEVDKNGQKWILEAKGTFYDCTRTKWEERASHFTEYGEIKGVDYSKIEKKKNKKENIEKQSIHNYKKGRVYTLRTEAVVRTTPKNKGVKNQMPYKKMTINAKLHARNENGFGILKQGTRVICKDIKITNNNTVWMKIPSGYICAKTKNKILVD